MLRLILIFLSLATALSSPAQADGRCTATYAYKDGYKQSSRARKPKEISFGFTMTAQGCLEICLNQRASRTKEGKGNYRKMEYSCSYGDTIIHQTTQTLY